jgi:hypothetical protein
VDDKMGEARRARSAALFNNSHLVDIVIAVHQLAPHAEDFVTTRKVAATTGLADSLVRPVMLRLVGSGILRRLPRLSGSRGEQHFARESAAQWSALLRLARAISGDTDTDTAAAATRASRKVAKGGAERAVKGATQ